MQFNKYSDWDLFHKEGSVVYFFVILAILVLDVPSLGFLASEIVSRKLILGTKLLIFHLYIHATFPALFIGITINVQDVAGETSHKESKADVVEDCEHSFILMDDMGYVCRVCGVIEKSILDIIDVNFSKVSILFSDFFFFFLSSFLILY